jgi:outer membrane beta-barrel protein
MTSETRTEPTLTEIVRPMNKMLRWTLVPLLALATLGVAQPAQAQNAEEGAAPTFEQDLDTFWADARSVRVLQRRLYETSGDFQLTLYGGAVPNDPFVNYFPVGGRFGYHTSESIAIELSGAYNIQSATELATFLRDENNVETFLRDVQLWRAHLAILWSPLYGKFSFLGTKLAHFDWYLGAGVGVVASESPPSSDDLTNLETSIKPEVVIVTGWNLHLHQRWALRLDYRQFIFQKEAGGVALPSELSLGVSFFF